MPCCGARNFQFAFAHKISTAATRSPRFIRHRRRFGSLPQRATLVGQYNSKIMRFKSHPRNQRKKASFWMPSLVAGMGFEPHDLRVMSPTSYQAALPRDIVGDFCRPPCLHHGGAGDRSRTGTIFSYHGILSPGRLPIPPHRQLISPSVHFIISRICVFVNP